MPEISLQWILWLLASLLVCRLFPARWRMDAIAVAGFAFLAVNAPWSGLALSGGSLLTAWAVRQSGRSRSQLPLLLVLSYAAAILVAHGLRARSPAADPDSVSIMVGAAYFACRQVHVAFEAYAGRLPGLTFADQLRYQFFLPTLVVGPIHRIRHFTRACLRRREHAADFHSGLERALFGAAKVAVIGNLLLEGSIHPWLQSHGPAGFAGALISGCLGWISLYLTFGGYSDLAIGFARAQGIVIEENFNRPWAAKNLIDFWQRWHMTLSGWCRDYVYTPLAAATRRHVLALLAAMLVMGLWHQLSAYYLLWGVYHASGIALCRVLQKAGQQRLWSQRYPGAMAVMARIATFAWLAGSAPVTHALLSLAGAPSP